MTKHLITSALPYINGTKHLGNLAGSLLPADVHARHLRQEGKHVLFVCATDEHGTPAELAAAAAGLTVADYCAREHEAQAETYRALNLSFDRFGRTSSEANRKLTQHFLLRLEEEGFVEEREIEQFWCEGDGRFLPDRYVLGTCPRCGDTNARGDQCDGCSALLDPTDLIDPRSAVSGNTDLEIRKTRHLFLRQSALEGDIRDWLDTREGWPPFVLSIARGWLAEGLKDRCITRDLSWGVPVPKPGWEGKVLYVWFDAPVAYLAETRAACLADPSKHGDADDWLKDSSDTRYVQFLGKDNVPFHALSFPATLLGSREPWKTVDVIKGFHWLAYDGGKFSTSRRRGVFLDRALEILPADAWRWWLCANSPETSDTDFTFERLAAGLNADLADNLGNLVNRVLKYVDAKYGGVVPADVPHNDELEAELGARLSALRAAHDAVEIRRAANEARAIWSLANAHVAKNGPWLLAKADPEAAAAAAATAVALLRVCALAAWPFIPTVARTILDAVGEREEAPRWGIDAAAELSRIAEGAQTILPPAIFAKLSPDWVECRTAEFGGNDGP